MKLLIYITLHLCPPATAYLPLNDIPGVAFYVRYHKSNISGENFDRRNEEVIYDLGLPSIMNYVNMKTNEKINFS